MYNIVTVSPPAGVTDGVSANNTATDIDLIVVPADIQVSKSGPAAVNAGANFTYTVVAANAGPGSASNVVVFDTLPVGAGFVSASAGGSLSNNVVYWPAIAAMTNGASLTYTLTVSAPPGGSLTNQAAASADSLDPAPGNNSATNAAANVITTVTPQADLQISKSGPLSVYALTNFSYTLTVTAPASGTLTNTTASTASTADPVSANNNGSSAAATVITTVAPRADIRTAKSGPSSANPGASFPYSITVTNLGPSAASNVVVWDNVPTGVSFVSASGGGAWSNNVVVWPALTALASGTGTNFTLIVVAGSNGVYTNTVASSSSTADPNSGNNNGTAAEATVITTISGVSVSGFVYNDLNRNSLKDASEAGTGLTLFAKLLPSGTPNGPATVAVSVDPATGACSLSGVANGTYIIVIDNNDTLNDVTPTLPAGWVGTEAPNQIRSNVLVNNVDLPNQNFGLIQSVGLSGNVFKDIGSGGGTANDGIQNGSEPGLVGVQVRLMEAGGAVYDTTTTDGTGHYVLLIPSSVAAGAQLQVVETNPNAYRSTGASVGSTGGAYDRPTDTVTFTFASGVAYVGVNFGDVPENNFTMDNQQTALPGSTVLYTHSFIAGTAGQVAFATTGVRSPNISGWNNLIYRDLNGSGQVDAGDPLLTGPVSVAAGDKVFVIVKEFVPGNAPYNAQDQITITASFDYLNAPPRFRPLTRAPTLPSSARPLPPA